MEKLPVPVAFRTQTLPVKTVDDALVIESTMFPSPEVLVTSVQLPDTGAPAEVATVAFVADQGAVSVVLEEIVFDCTATFVTVETAVEGTVEESPCPKASDGRSRRSASRMGPLTMRPSVSQR
jgi:hypothetical protein